MNVLSSFVTENTVAALALLCIPVSGVFLILQKDRLKLDKWWKLVIALLAYVILGLLSLAVFSILHDIRTFPEWHIHHQGLMIVFPLLFPLIAKLLKTDWLEVSDALAVSIPGIIAVLRIFCLVRGCCFGRPLLGSAILWPVRELAMALNFACCIVFLLWNNRSHMKGIILPAYLVFYGVYRTAEIMLRSEYYSLTNAEDYFFSILSLLTGVFCLLWLDEKNKRKKGRTDTNKKY